MLFTTKTTRKVTINKNFRKVSFDSGRNSIMRDLFLKRTDTLPTNSHSGITRDNFTLAQMAIFVVSRINYEHFNRVRLHTYIYVNICKFLGVMQNKI